MCTRGFRWSIVFLCGIQAHWQRDSEFRDLDLQYFKQMNQPHFFDNKIYDSERKKPEEVLWDSSDRGQCGFNCMTLYARIFNIITQWPVLLPVTHWCLMFCLNQINWIFCGRFCAPTLHVCLTGKSTLKGIQLDVMESSVMNCEHANISDWTETFFMACMEVTEGAVTIDMFSF